MQFKIRLILARTEDHCMLHAISDLLALRGRQRLSYLRLLRAVVFCARLSSLQRCGWLLAACGLAFLQDFPRELAMRDLSLVFN
jgi:hypothetical protein